MRFLIKKDISGALGIYAGDRMVDSKTAHLGADFHLSENGIQMTNVNGKWEKKIIPIEIFNSMRDSLELKTFLINNQREKEMNKYKEITVEFNSYTNAWCAWGFDALTGNAFDMGNFATRDLAISNLKDRGLDHLVIQ